MNLLLWVGSIGGAPAPGKKRRARRAEPLAKTYSDLAITPVVDGEDEALEMFTLNDSARAAVAKARTQAQRRRQGEKPPLNA
jgi:hypothetical protein